MGVGKGLPVLWETIIFGPSNDDLEILAFIHTQRTRTTPFDALAFGLTSGTDKAADAAHVASFAQAGATWWLEHFAPHQTLEQVRQRIHQGPPRF